MVSPKLSTLRVVVLPLVLSAVAFGQAGLGSITGTVVDASGSVVPAAAIRLVEVSTQSIRNTNSTDAGVFTFPSVVPGQYEITFSAPGFKESKLENISVSAFQQLSLGAVKLDIGQGPTASVTVTAEQQLVKESGVRFETILAKQVAEMPSYGGNWSSLLKIIPGAVPTNSQAFNGREYGFYGYADFKVNGKTPSQTQVNLDGGGIVDHGSDAKVTVSPSLESIQEVAILTNNFQAEYGNRSGIVINIVTKSGSNSFHGVGFENLRNEALNANSWTNNYLGVKRTPYRFNYFGGNFSGPIKRNRLFFFYNIENFKQFVPSSAALSRVPTEIERNGDFSKTVYADGSKPVIYQPGSQFSGTPIPMAGNVVPASLITSWGKALMNVYPTPNYSGDVNNNYLFQYQTKLPRLSQVAKVDWNVGDNTRVYVRYSDDEGTNVDRGTWNSSVNLPFNMIQQKRPDRAVAGNLTHTFSPTLVLEVLGGWQYDYPNLTPLNPDLVDKTKLGLSDLPTIYKPASNILPEVITGVYPAYAFGRLPAYALANEYQMAGTVSWTHGTHLVKFGAQHIRSYKDEVNNTADKGQYDFRGSPSQFDTNYGPSNMLLGSLASFYQVQTVIRKDSIFKDYHFYVQDTWKVRRGLTFDYGLRLYHMPSEYNRDPVALNDGVFLPSRWDAAKAPRFYIPDPKNSKNVIDPANPASPLPSNLASLLLYSIVPGSGDPLNGVVSLGQGGVGSAGMKNPKALLLAPRGGVAWSPGGNQKTVIRGGFGWAYNRNLISQSIGYFNNVLSPFVNLLQTSLTAMAAPTTAKRISPGSFGARDEAGGKVPTVYDYSVSLQQELPYRMIVEVAYIGNLQRHQPLDFNLNAILPGTLWKTQYIDSRSSGSNFYGPVSASNAGALPGTNAMDAIVMRPYTGLNTLTMTANVANARHDSFQTSVNKRWGFGLMLQAAYTYGRTLTQTENAGLYSYKWKDYTGYVSGSDRRQVFSLNYTYQLPKFAEHLSWKNGFTRAVLNGWSIAHLATFFSGLGFSPAMSILQANTNNAVPLNQIFLGTPDLGPRLALPGDKGAIGADIYHWFDPTKVSVPALFPSGDGTGLRNFLNAPGAFSNDISIIKNFRIHESRTLELRANMFNVFNQVRRLGVNSTVTYKAQGRNYSDGFGLYNTPEQLAARLAASGVNNPLTLYNSYRIGAGALNLTGVEQMRIIEIGLKFRF